MSASPDDTARKVRQLDHDVQAIYEMLATIEATQRRQSNRLEEIAHTQADQAGRLDGIAQAQADQDSKLDRILGLLES